MCAGTRARALVPSPLSPSRKVGRGDGGTRWRGWHPSCRDRSQVLPGGAGSEPLQEPRGAGIYLLAAFFLTPILQRWMRSRAAELPAGCLPCLRRNRPRHPAPPEMARAAPARQREEGFPAGSRKPAFVQDCVKACLFQGCFSPRSTGSHRTWHFAWPQRRREPPSAWSRARLRGPSSGCCGNHNLEIPASSAAALFCTH